MDAKAEKTYAQEVSDIVGDVAKWLRASLAGTRRVQPQQRGRRQAATYRGARRNAQRHRRRNAVCKMERTMLGLTRAEYDRANWRQQLLSAPTIRQAPKPVPTPGLPGAMISIREYAQAMQQMLAEQLRQAAATLDSMKPRLAHAGA